jgi:hypothetical protein
LGSWGPAGAADQTTEPGEIRVELVRDRPEFPHYLGIGHRQPLRIDAESEDRPRKGHNDGQNPHRHHKLDQCECLSHLGAIQNLISF